MSTCRFCLTEPADPSRSHYIDGTNIPYKGVPAVRVLCKKPAVGDLTIKGLGATPLCQEHLDYVRSNLTPLLVSDPEAVRACAVEKAASRPRRAKKPAVCPHCGKPIP